MRQSKQQEFEDIWLISEIELGEYQIKNGDFRSCFGGGGGCRLCQMLSSWQHIL